MNEKILLINVHSSKNVGDAALVQVTLQQLKKNFPTSQVLLCMDDPDSHTGPEKTINSISSWVYPIRNDGKAGWNYLRLAMLLPVSLVPLLSQKLFGRKIWSLSPASIRRIIDAYLDADLVVSKPGGFLYSSGRGINLLIAIYSIIFAHWAGKPVYIFPQSIGPLNHWWELSLLRQLFERVRIVMVREPVSLEFIRDIGLRNPRVYLIPDSAFCLSDAGSEAGNYWLQQHGINPQFGFPLLGMTIINWGAQNRAFDLQLEYESACAVTVKYFVEKINGRVILFPQVYGPLESQDDRIPAHRVLDRISYLTGYVKVIDQPVPAELLKSIYGWMDVFIGTRMHSNIFALSKGVPIVAIGYLHKTEGIARMVGVEKWVIDIRHVKGNVLQEKLAELWSVRQEWKQKIQDKLPSLLEEANKAGKLVADDYFGYWMANKSG
jgi:colanic acid/amylovoran biosynthesis protein